MRCIRFAYHDSIVLKVRQECRLARKSLCQALGINTDDEKDLRGLWLAKTEWRDFGRAYSPNCRTGAWLIPPSPVRTDSAAFTEAIEVAFPSSRLGAAVPLPHGGNSTQWLVEPQQGGVTGSE